MGLGAYKKLFPEEWGLIRAGRLIGHLRCMSMAKLFPFIQYRVCSKNISTIYVLLLFHEATEDTIHLLLT